MEKLQRECNVIAAANNIMDDDVYVPFALCHILHILYMFVE